MGAGSVWEHSVPFAQYCCEHKTALKDKVYFFKLIYLWLRWVFVAALGLSLAASGATLRCGAQASHCSGFSCCGEQALGAQASVVVAHRL